MQCLASGQNLFAVWHLQHISLCSIDLSLVSGITFENVLFVPRTLSKHVERSTEDGNEQLTVNNSKWSQIESEWMQSRGWRSWFLSSFMVLRLFMHNLNFIHFIFFIIYYYYCYNLLPLYYFTGLYFFVFYTETVPLGGVTVGPWRTVPI